MLAAAPIPAHPIDARNNRPPYDLKHITTTKYAPHSPAKHRHSTVLASAA